MRIYVYRGECSYEYLHLHYDSKKNYHHAHDVKVNLDTVYFPSKLR
jgi:hypothetical protein